MIKKSLRIVAVLSLTLVVSLGSTAYALTGEEVSSNLNPSQCSEQCTRKDNGKHKHGGFKGLTSIKELGLTQDDIDNGKASGKTIFDIVKEKKGLKPEEVRSIIIKAKTEAINKKVEEGTLTKEKAEEKISKLKEKIEKWDGSLKATKNSKESNKENKTN
jgi:hypothetical protein